METTALQKVGVKLLTPQNSRIFFGRLGSIHCISDDEAFANVYCVLTFPIHYPNNFISVCYSDDEGKEKEIGVIKDLTIFPEEGQKIVKKSLSRHYFEQTITRIFDVRWEYGLLFLDVEVNEERKKFNMRWQHNKALEYGKDGKVLLDTFENRYVIPHIQELPQSDRNRLMRFIYW